MVRKKGHQPLLPTILPITITWLCISFVTLRDLEILSERQMKADNQNNQTQSELSAMMPLLTWFPAESFPVLVQELPWQFALTFCSWAPLAGVRFPMDPGTPQPVLVPDVELAK